MIACQGKEEVKEEVLRPVKYQVAGAGSEERIRTFSGIAKAGNEIELSFRSGGIIEVTNVETGQQVNKGDLIARLDNVEARLAYEKSVSALNSAESALSTAQKELERIKTLYERESVSLGDYERAKNAYQTALAQFESAQRNRSLQQTQINYGYIYAPSDGVIANTNGSVNERVNAGHMFAILNAGEQIKVEVGLPENAINQISLGMETSISFSAIPDQSFTGNVVEVSPITSQNTATYPVDVEIIDASEAIKPGMAARVTFDFGGEESQSASTLVIPIKAVGEDGDGNFVFVIESEDGEVGQVKRQAVEIGDMTTTGFIINSGLQEGQLVATAGLQTLLDGQKVRLQKP